jgi:hypothetical protein
MNKKDYLLPPASWPSKTGRRLALPPSSSPTPPHCQWVPSPSRSVGICTRPGRISDFHQTGITQHLGDPFVSTADGAWASRSQVGLTIRARTRASEACGSSLVMARRAIMNPGIECHPSLDGAADVEEAHPSQVTVTSTPSIHHPPRFLSPPPKQESTANTLLMPPPKLQPWSPGCQYSF